MQMQNLIRNTLILLIAIIVAFLVVPFFQQYLFYFFFMDRTFSSSSEWLDELSMLQWLFYALFFTAFGFILAKLINSTRRWLWVTSLGVIYSVILLAISKHYFYQETTVANYFWAYGLYAMPIFGTWLGYFLQMKLSRQSIRHLTTQSR
jgi:hypothetical protein